ncbi:hypothetical protein Tco_0739640 [Tanacetum coccineum]
MPKATTTDVSLTKSCIPKVSKIPGISPNIAQFYKPIENRNTHEGHVVDQACYKSNNIERLFTNIRFNCLFQINEPIVLRFILDFYSQVTGPYCTDLPTPNDIRRLLELERVAVDRTIKTQTVALNPNQILTKELSPDMKQWEELIRENVFGLGGHRDRLPACLAHMLYCVVAEEQYNLAYFFVKRIECAKATPTANLPYGMFLTRLYRYVMETYPHLDNGTYDIVERVMRPLALRQTRRPRSDHGKARRSVSFLILSSSRHVISSTTRSRRCDEYLKILEQDNTFNGMNGVDVTDHIARVLEITEWIKIPNVEKNVLRLYVFSKSLSGDAEKWWNDEIEGKAIGWNETCNKFCHKYYSLSHSSNCKVPDDLDNGTDYLEFFYWLALKFDNYWEIDKNTQNGLWEFYMNEPTKGAMGDLDDEPRNESYKKECSDMFYKPYLDTQDTKDIYEIIDREYNSIPIPAPHDIDNPDELCRTECVSVETTREIIMESLVKKKQKGAILELKQRHLKNTIFCTYTPYPAMKIRRISASSAQETRNDQFSIWRIHYNQYAVCTAVHQSKIHI